MRRRTGDGGRVSNPRFDRCEDELVLQAIAFLEHSEDAMHAWWAKQQREELLSGS